MDNNIKSQILELSDKTDSSYKAVQRQYIPSVYKLQIEIKFKEDYDMWHRGFAKNSLNFIIHNLPIKYASMNKIFFDTLDNLIKKDITYPMLFFYKGKFVRWSDVLIKSTRRYTFISFRNINTKEYVDNDDVQCILLPLRGIYYRQDVAFNFISGGSLPETETPIFVFNSNGLLVRGVPNDNNDTYTIVSSLKNRNDYLTEQFTALTNQTYKSDIVPKGKYLSESNVIYFVDSKLPERAFDKAQYRKDGHDLFSIRSPKDETVDVKIFYFNKGKETANIIGNIPTPTLSNYNYDREFDFTFDRNKSYEENLNDALEYCMKYNSAYLNQVYKDMSNIKSVVYTGKHIKSLISKNNTVRMSTRKDLENYNKVIIYQNGLLFKNYHTLRYIDIEYEFYLDPGDVKDDDIFEILYFKKSYNLVKPMNLSSSIDDQYYIGEDVDITDFTLFSTNLYKDHKFFNIETSEKAQYAIPFTYKKLEKDIYEIIPTHPYYYDKECALVSNRQFRYYYKKINSDNCVDIELSDDFKFCIDPDKYMVYINGRKLSRKNFKVTVVKNTRPFHRHCVYTNIPMTYGDKIEVFYVPDKLTEVYEGDIDVKHGGVIELDKDKLQYNIDNELFLFYVNGKKILSKDIQNISKNIIKINTTDSIHNLCIIKHINPNTLLYKLFKYNEDIMDKIIKELKLGDMFDELNRMYGVSRLKSGETDYDINSIEMKTVLHKLIRDFWNKPYVSDGQEFIYDFDTDELDIDSDGNIIIPSMNGNVY